MTIKLPEPQWLGDIPGYTEAQLKQALRDVLEQAAQMCSEIGTKHRDTYKGRTDPIDTSKCYDPVYDGMADGAWECEDAIRKMIGEI